MRNHHLNFTSHSEIVDPAYHNLGVPGNELHFFLFALRVKCYSIYRNRHYRQYLRYLQWSLYFGCQIVIVIIIMMMM